MKDLKNTVLAVQLYLLPLNISDIMGRTDTASSYRVLFYSKQTKRSCCLMLSNTAPSVPIKALQGTFQFFQSYVIEIQGCYHTVSYIKYIIYIKLFIGIEINLPSFCTKALIVHYYFAKLTTAIDQECWGGVISRIYIYIYVRR